ncbi:spermidine hydroxycinnamoyl transferase-like [Humulus lupulus]|uniref:spermidine hydroxycinnamoyl transferase-like n=1 Tax=Humulus lupulus TaxID=3486 RepID=UPI002B403763|nr:spermidine hydroxycinnamoyl transferase-like [Humulus lupulus]
MAGLYRRISAGNNKYRRIYHVLPAGSSAGNEWLKENDTVFNVLKESLSRALKIFYPLAGRLRWIEGSGNVLELDCNGKGAKFIEAECESALDDFHNDQLASLTDQYRNLFPDVDYNIPLQDIPVTLVQATRFACGGISLAVSLSHAVVDGQSAFSFISEWASLTRGEGVNDPLRRFLHDDGENAVLPKQKTTMVILKLGKLDREKLREKANNGLCFDISVADRSYTRFELLAAHVWRCACKARKHEPEQPTSLAICVDSKRRLNPPLPNGFIGNATFDVTATGRSGELVSKPLGHAASIIKATLKKVTSEFIWSAVDYLKYQTDLSMFQSPLPTNRDESFVYQNPNLGIISWLGLPMYGQDFGWGKEIDMVLGEIEPGSVVLIPDCNDDGSMVVALCLQTDHMDSFKNHFYNII